MRFLVYLLSLLLIGLSYVVEAQNKNSFYNTIADYPQLDEYEVIIKYKNDDLPGGKLDELRDYNDRQTNSVRRLAGKKFIGLLEKYDITYLDKNITIHQHDNKSTFYTIVVKNAISETLKELNAIPEIEYAELSPIYEIDVVPNDPSVNAQYALNITQSFLAFDQFSDIGLEPNIAIIDDAIFIGHEDLTDNIYINPDEIPENGIDDDGNGYIDDVNGWDASGNQYNNGDPDPSPPTGRADLQTFSHGTHVAGIAGAVTDNDLGIASISYNSCKIIPIKATRDNAPNPRLIERSFAAITYAVTSDADIISMSFGGSGYSQAIQDLINFGVSQGKVFVAAAGNDNSSVIQYPAGYENVIAVASTDQTDTRSSFSNFGTWVDVVAPGTDILSTVFDQENQNSGNYFTYDGTSMSTPMVAGLIGLVMSQNSSLSPQAIDLILKRTSDNIDNNNPNHIGLLGYGRINARRAIELGKMNDPIADFLINDENLRVGIPISFQDNSFSVGSITYEWKFGDGSFSSEKNPTHTYTVAGNYRVTLTITEGSKTDNISSRITVLPPAPVTPYVSIPYTLADGGDFESNPDDFQSEILFGDFDLWERGIPQNELREVNSPENAWKTNLFGDLVKDSYACALYTPRFDMSNTNQEYIMQFYKSMESEFCNAPAGVQVQYSLDSGKTWTRLGGYRDPFGVNWYNKDPSGSCPISSLVIQDQQGWIGNFNNELTQYNISFLAGNPHVQFRFVLFVSGEFQSDIQDDGFMIDDFEILANPPSVAFVVDKNVQYPGAPLYFTYTGGGADSYLWDFGDGNTSTQPNPTHIYTEPGNYVTKLTIQAGADIIESVNNTSLRILPLVFPPFRLIDGGDFEIDNSTFGARNVKGTPLERGLSTIDGKQGAASGSFAWVTGLQEPNYQDDSEAYLYSPLINFERPGKYTISFKAKHSFEDTWDGFIIEYSTDYGLNWTHLDPVVRETWHTTISNENSVFGNAVPIFSGTTNGEFVTYSTDLSELAGAEYVAFRLKFLTDANETDVGLAVDDFQIFGPPGGPAVPSFSVSELTSCVDQVLTFSNTSKGQIDSYTWDFGSGAIPSTATGPGPHDVAYNTSGLKTVELTVTSSVNGTQVVRLEDFISVFERPEITSFLISPTSICSGDTVDVTVENSNSNYNYVLINEDIPITPEIQGNDGLLNFKAWPVTAELVQLMVTNSGGCVTTNDYSGNFVVNPTPEPTISYDDPILISSEADAYQWYKNNELIAGANSQTFEAEEPAEYQVEVTVDGCSGISEIFSVITSVDTEISQNTIHVFPNPTSNQIFIEVPSAESQRVELELISLNGKRLFKSKNLNQERIALNISPYVSPLRTVVLLKITTTKTSYYKKILFAK